MPGSVVLEAPSNTPRRSAGNGVGFQVGSNGHQPELASDSQSTMNSDKRTKSGRRASRAARRKSKAAKLLEEELEAVTEKRPHTPWQMFEDHLKNVNDDTLTYNTNAKPLDLRSSDIFQKVMGDINQKRREKELRELKRQEEAARRALEGQNKEEDGVEEEEEEESSDYTDTESEDDEEKPKEVSRSVKMAAQRGWAIIRRKIQELKLEKKKNDAGNSWSFLRRTLKNMTNMEKAREELYEKYLYKPNSWMEGLTDLPEHILPSFRRNASVNSCGANVPSPARAGNRSVMSWNGNRGRMSSMSVKARRK